jgi:hypothetical protein
MRKYRKIKQIRKVKGQDDILSPVPGFDSSLDFGALEQTGLSGFSEAKAMITRMIQEGFEDIDIIIQLHEKLPPEVAQTALNECKQRGLL